MASFARSSSVPAHLPQVTWHALARGLRATLLIMLGFAAGAMVATLAPPLLGAAVHGAARAVTPPPRPAGPAPELSREWRWEPKTFTFEHMVREKK